MEPVATQGMMGDRATVVTYLREEEEEQAGEGCAQQVLSWERYPSDGWSQISLSGTSKQRAAAYLRRRFRGEDILHHCTQCFWATLIKGGGNIPTF